MPACSRLGKTSTGFEDMTPNSMPSCRRLRPGCTSAPDQAWRTSRPQGAIARLTRAIAQSANGLTFGRCHEHKSWAAHSRASISRELATKQARRAPVGGRGFLPAVVRTEMDQPAVHNDFGPPLGPAPRDPDNSGSAAGHGIPPVLRRRDVSQVGNTIVRPVFRSCDRFRRPGACRGHRATQADAPNAATHRL